MINLESICHIYSGYSFRGRVEHDLGGDTHVVQMKNLRNEYTDIDFDLTMVDGRTIKDKYTLEEGDVLFISKGANNYAIAFHLNLPRVVASSVFYVLRPHAGLAVHPDYLAWFINQKDAQNHIKSRMVGTRIPNVNINTMRSLPIQLPVMKIQESIATVHQLQNREQRIQKQLLENRTVVINTLLNTRVND